MKNLFLALACTILSFSLTAQEEYDMQVSGSFSPTSIDIGEASNFEITYSNLTLTGLSVPAGDFTLQITIGGGATAMETSPPTGPNADDFDWLFLGTNIWYGTSNVDIPFTGMTLQVDIPVIGAYESGNASNYDGNIVNPDNDSNDQNDTGSATLNVSSVLPVEFSYFNVEGSDCNTVGLVWETAQEINNEGFYVERNVDGSGKFETVGFVKGSGTTKKATQYTYKDDISRISSSPEVIYYRLKQVDLDGRSDFSDIIKTEIDCEEVLTISGYPNPVVTTYNLEITGVTGTNVVSIHNNAGQMVKQVKVERNTTSTIDMVELESGVYTINVLNDDNIIEKSMKVIKISN